MAIYRPTKPRWRLALATGVLGLIVGLTVGLALGQSDPDSLESARVIQTELASAAGSLEVAAVEYEEAVQDGEVVKQAEYEGALAALESSRAKYTAVRPALELIHPTGLEALDDLYADAEELMQDAAPAADVSPLLEELEALLKGD